MTTTIAATVQGSDPLPVIRLDITMDAGAVSWQVVRSSPTDTVVVYMGGSGSTAISIVDQTAPLGVAITYQLAVVYSGSTVYASAAPVTITGTAGCYLTDPAAGQTMKVEISEWPSRKRTARQALVEVLARSDPVGLTDAYNTPAGTWTLISRSDAYTASLISLLCGRGVVVLRTQPGSSIASCTALVGDVDEQRFSDTGGDQRRLVTVDVQEIAPLPATALPFPATLLGLSTYQGITTLQGMSLLRPTLVALSQIQTG